MKEKSFIITIALSFVSFFFSCESVIYEAHSLENFVSMTTPKDIGEYEVVGKLKYDTKAVFLVLQLITIRDAEIDNAIQKQVGKYEGDGVINLKIHEQYKIVDIIIAAFVGGLLNTRTVEVRGDIIRINPASTVEIPELTDQIELAILDYNEGVVK